MTMNNSDLRFIAGAVVPADIIEKRNASLEAGFLGFDFCGPRPQPLTPQQVWELNCVNREKEFLAQFDAKWKDGLPAVSREKLIREAAAQAETNRLVQGRKSPTQEKDPQQARLDKLLAQRDYLERRITLDSTAAFDNHDTLYGNPDAPEPAKPKTEKAAANWRHKRNKRKKLKIKHKLSTVRLMHREWSGQYRILHTTQTSASEAPQPQAGDRYTEKLTQRAVGKIFESAAYVATCQSGFTTFLTPTFTPEQRERIFSGDITIGSEISRFLDSLKKMYRRGWQFADALGFPVEIDGIDEPFHYIWVAECPANEDGEPNPHVHILLNWQVDPSVFQAWAARIESLWGHGMAHLERIHEPKAAGSYLIKAVGYAAKGENADQGLIRGNRYNIARCSRAPDWSCLASFEADNMAAIIRECGYKLEQWRRPMERSLERLQKAHRQTIKAVAMANAPDMVGKLRNRLNRLEKQMRETREQMRSRQVHASSKNMFCMSFDGEQAEEKVHDFLLWAAGARGWSMKPIIAGRDGSPVIAINDGEYYQDYLPDDREWLSCAAEARRTARQHYKRQFENHLNRRRYWRSVLNDEWPPQPTEDELKQQKTESMNLLAQYEGACHEYKRAVG
ncbi:rolling circle replication-associated protein [Photobacterium halotolerans]|nr:hypothetical protein [Photobacterium halotolerans]